LVIASYFFDFSLAKPALVRKKLSSGRIFAPFRNFGHRCAPADLEQVNSN